MSYFDPDVYNYGALKDADKKLIDMYDSAIEDAQNADYILDQMDIFKDDKSILTSIRREVALQTLDKVSEYLESQKSMQIVSIIDSYEEE
jgi:hypothetical protein